MAIGTLGPIVFNSSSEKVQTFEGFNLNKSSRISIHENLQNKPIAEFIGPGLDDVGLKLTWSIEGNINPKAEIKKLEDMQEKGEVVVFFLGGKPVGKGRYLINKISEVNKRVDNKGNIMSMSIDINLDEYVVNARKEVRTIATPKAVSTPKKSTNTVQKKTTTPKTKPKSIYKADNEIQMPTFETKLSDLLLKAQQNQKGGGGRSFGGSGTGGGGAGGF